MKNQKDSNFDKTGNDVIQHLLELSEAGAAGTGQKQAPANTQEGNTEQQVQ